MTYFGVSDKETPDIFCFHFGTVSLSRKHLQTSLISAENIGQR